MKPRSGLILVLSRPTFSVRGLRPTAIQNFLGFDLLLLSVDRDGDGNSRFRLLNLVDLRAGVEALSALAEDSNTFLLPVAWLGCVLLTTDEDLRDVLESGSGLKAGVDFHLAFSPEREDPGNAQSKVEIIPKVIGGYTPACLERAKAVYGKAIKTIVPVSSCRVAEATKLLENIFRSVNIALVNELKVVYSAMGIDVWEVINAAKTKPFGFMAFYPGPGLGGHCIPIDPFYLTWKAREYSQNTRFIELAGEINTAMPMHVVNRTAEALNCATQGGERQPGAGGWPGLQTERGRRTGIAELHADEFAEGTRGGTGLL